MTCIVGLEHKGTVYMGGDSAGASDWNIRIVTTPKVFRKEKLLVGYTWSFRMGQIIQYASNLPEILEHSSNYSYLIESFIPFIRKAFQDAGYLKVENSREEGGRFMVGIRGEVFVIEENFAVLRSVDGFEAIGCGALYALGTLFNLKKSMIENPIELIECALKTAEYFSNGVSAPFIFEKLDMQV